MAQWHMQAELCSVRPEFEIRVLDPVPYSAILYESEKSLNVLPLLIISLSNDGQKFSLPNLLSEGNDEDMLQTPPWRWHHSYMFLPKLQQNFPSISSQAEEHAMSIPKCDTTQRH